MRKHLTFKFLLLFFGSLLVIELASAAQMRNQIDLGAGYSIPNGRPASAIGGSIDTNASFGLDCNGINWVAQMTQQMTLDMGMADIQSMGTGAIAAGASYLAASLRPTWYSSVQNMIKNAKAKLSGLQSDCRSMEAALLENDPLGILKKRDTANQVMTAAAADTPFDEAVRTAEAATNIDWSLHGEIDGTNMDPATKNTLKAFLGNVRVQIGNGSKQINSDIVKEDELSNAFIKVKDELTVDLTNRLVYGTNCELGLFETAPPANGAAPAPVTPTPPLNNPASFLPADAARVNTANQLGVPLTGVTDPATGLNTLSPADVGVMNNASIAKNIKDELRGKNFPETNCANYEYYKSIDMPAAYRRQMAAMFSDFIALRGLASAIETVKANMQGVKENSENKEMIEMTKDRLTMLETRYKKLRDSVELADKQMQVQLRAKELTLRKRAIARAKQRERVQQTIRKVQGAQGGPGAGLLDGM